MRTTAPAGAVAGLHDPALWHEIVETIGGLEAYVWDDPHVTDERTRAEGLRYLTRLVAGAIPIAMETWDPEYPKLHQFLDSKMQFGVPAADCSYGWAGLHGDHVYRIRGHRGSSLLFDVETRTGHMGHIADWKLIDRRSDFRVEADGSVEIVLSREEQPGNWVRLPAGPASIIVRQYFYDWLTEEPALLEITRDGATFPPPPLDPSRVAERAQLLRDWLRQVPAACAHAVRTHHEVPAGTLAFGPLDFGWKDLQYGKGAYRCGPDEAVVLEVTPPDAPYWSFQLCSLFWEARDWDVRQTSINGHQAVLDDDGKFRAVISHRDPGVPNWLDAGGHEKGLIVARYFRAAETLQPGIRPVNLADLRRLLPASTPRVTPEERQESLRARARSVVRRRCD